MSSEPFTEPLTDRRPQTSVPLGPARYSDVALLILAAPISVLLGASAAGYGIGAAMWIVLRAFGVAVERYAGATATLTHLVSLRMAFRLVRVFSLITATGLIIKDGGRADGLTTLIVISGAFTIQLSLSLLARRPA
jgi:hypothetical protein